MKYPLEEADFKPEEKPAVFEGGKWYKRVVSNSRYFTRGCYYLCGKGPDDSDYLVSDDGTLLKADNLNSKFSGPH